MSEPAALLDESPAIAPRYASVGRRALAACIDLLAAVAIVCAVFLAAFLAVRLEPASAHAVRAQTPYALAVVSAGRWCAFVAVFAYYIVCEWRFAGRTVGKAFLRIRVVRDDGGEIGFPTAVIRNAFRFFELLLGAFTVTAVTALVSKRHKRIGDYLARTIVVADERPETSARAFPLWPSLGAIATAAAIMLGVLFVGVVLFLVVRLPSTAMSDGSPPGSLVEGAAYFASAAFLAWVLPRLARAPLARFLRMPTRGEFAVAAVGAVIAIGFDLLSSAVIRALHIRHVQAGFEHFHPHGFAAYGLATAVAATAAPVCEELLFRGVLLNTLAPRLPFWLAALITSIAFALVHGDAVYFISLAAIAMLFAYAYRRTGNLAVPMLMHGAMNAFAFLT